MICEDCEKHCIQFKATSLMVRENVFQTKRYYRCRSCGCVYVEVLNCVDIRTGCVVDECCHVEKYPVVKDTVVSLDRWI